jgi:hypothetical protein
MATTASPVGSHAKDHLDREEPSVDEQVSQPTEDTHSTSVDEPEPVESEDEWLDDEAGED